MLEKDLIDRLPLSGMKGRRTIYTNVKRITHDNVVNVLDKALAIHAQNQSEISYLSHYNRSVQDVRHKCKLVRSEINNKIVVNRANEIVTFKTSYFLSSPIQYVSAGGDDEVSKSVDLLNAYMRAEDKESKDKAVVDWMHICGVGVRMVLSDEDAEKEGSPVCIYTPDPRDAFVIYSGAVGHKPMAGVLIQRDEADNPLYCVYTTDQYYEIQKEIVNIKERTVPYIPIIEYLNNNVRMGAFEVVLSMLNAINDITSNRLDAIQDFVNAYDVFQNCEIDADTYKELTSGGKAIQIKSQQGMEAKVYRITSTLDQNSTQTFVNDLYDSVLEICGMPNRNGGASTSDTGTATIFRDGWASAESRAQDTQKMFNEAEKQFLKNVLYICREHGDFDLALSDIKIEHTRNNLSNMQSRMQILCEGLNNEKIHPKIPWVLAGIPNAEELYRVSMEYYEEQQRKLMESIDNEQSVQTQRQGNRSPEQAAG